MTFGSKGMLRVSTPVSRIPKKKVPAIMPSRSGASAKYTRCIPAAISPTAAEAPNPRKIRKIGPKHGLPAIGPHGEPIVEPFLGRKAAAEVDDRDDQNRAGAYVRSCHNESERHGHREWQNSDPSAPPRRRHELYCIRTATVSSVGGRVPKLPPFEFERRQRWVAT